jgi:hypothetical protein
MTFRLLVLIGRGSAFCATIGGLQRRTRDERGSQNGLESELARFHFVQYLVDHFGQIDSHWATAG